MVGAGTLLEDLYLVDFRNGTLVEANEPVVDGMGVSRPLVSRGRSVVPCPRRLVPGRRG